MTRTEAMEVYHDRSAKFKNTQSIQWKMNLSIWTILVLAIFYKSKINFPSCNGDCITWSCGFQILMSLIVIFVHFSYCYRIQRSLDSDKAVKKSIVTQLNSSINPNLNVKIDLESESAKSPWAWIVIQITVTAILVIVFWFSK